MTNKFLILAIFLSVCLSMVVSFHIEHVERFSQIKNENRENIIFSFNHTQPSRSLQTISLNIDDVNSVTKGILSILNGLRAKQGLSELSKNQQDSDILGRWSVIFKKIYSAKEYLERLRRYSGGRLVDFSGFLSGQVLIKGVQKLSLQWILVGRLTQVGIIVEKIQNKYNALILVKNFNLVDSQIQVKTYTESDVNAQENLPKPAATPIQEKPKSEPIIQDNASTKKLIAYESNLNLLAPVSLEIQASTNKLSQLQEAPVLLESPPSKIVTIPSNAIQQKTISNRVFTELILSHDIPSTFLTSQNFLLKGKLVSAPTTEQGTTINIIFNLENTNQTSRFSGWVPKGSVEFEILLTFSKLKEGKYFMSALVNFKTFSTAKIVTVKSNSNLLRTQLENSPLTPQNLTVSLNGNDFYCIWNQNDRNALIRITFQQKPNKIKQYILSNFPSKFKVPYKDFYDFGQGQVTVKIASAYSNSLSQSGRLSEYSETISIVFQAVKHHFDEIRSNQIQLFNDIPFKIKTGQTININGKALNQISNKIYVLQPGNVFSEQYFNEQNKSDVFTVGRTFSKKLTFPKEGVYILQVNNFAGGAVINQPIYVGERFPLLPDYQDLRPEPRPFKQIADSQPATLTLKRELMLRLINEKRAEFGVKPIVGDPDLDRLAQMHSDDMVARNFFGHVNPSKQGPQQRATRLGIQQGVSENIAMNNNVTDGHFSLCRSNAHLMNVVNKEWEKVGLGFAWSADYSLYITQEFAGRDYIKDPLTEIEITAYKLQLISSIKIIYPSVKSENVNLSSGLKQWQSLPSETQNSQSIMTFLRSKGLRNFSIGNLRIYFRQNFIQNMKTSGYLESDKPNPTQVGIGMKMSNGWLEIFIAYI